MSIDEINKYLNRLAKLYYSIDNNFDKEVFYAICSRYQDFVSGRVEVKNITKKEIVERLVRKGLMSMSKNDKLPDDRPVRRSVRFLTKNGFPILSTCTQNGYYIADNAKEIERPREENKKKAISALAVQRGYDKMTGFVNGQLEILELCDDENEEKKIFEKLSEIG